MMIRREFLRLISALPFAGVLGLKAKDKTQLSVSLKQERFIESYTQNGVNSFPMDVPLGTFYSASDGRIYRLGKCHPYKRIDFPAHRLYSTNDGNGNSFFGLPVAYTDDGVWLMVDSGPHTVSIEVA